MIDFHCHLDLYPNPHEVAKECERRELHVLSVTTTPSAWRGTCALPSTTSTKIHTALGLHPQLAAERSAELALFEELLPRAPFVGEVGLDGAPEFRGQWKTQVDVFRRILELCQSAGGRILSVHSRRAGRAVLDHLERVPGVGIVILHWFSDSTRELDRATELGCWFSVGPAMLAGQRGRSLVARMPRERVLTESDGPFAQLDGKPAYPWDTAVAIEHLAGTWHITMAAAREQLLSNLDELLSQAPSP